ncbi:MAG: hypothetical protein LBJ25_06755 [Candidatus Margulisbacteria bacterium]|jgi:hypothetical protein|nr:hypothetical protein [Candidatus Margulisiibacteriota bacterium]
MSKIFGANNNVDWSSVKNTNAKEVENKNPYYNKDTGNIILVGDAQENSTSIDLSQNKVEQHWGNNNNKVYYKTQGNTLNIQASNDLPNNINSPSPEVVDSFSLADGIQTNGHKKLIITVLNKTGNFIDDNCIGFAIKGDHSDGFYPEAPIGWNMQGEFISTKQLGEGYGRRALSVGDRLEFDISNRSEIYIGGKVIAGNSGRLIFSFELAD